jgi:dihydropteroate synthase type 2
MKIVGIVNITADSFSDGGKFLDPDEAIAHAKKLITGGADIIELSGASSNPHSEAVSAKEQIARMEPVLSALDCDISIDATNQEVQRWALSKQVAYINDIKGFPEESFYPELARSDTKLIVMHAMMGGEKAERAEHTTEEVLESIYSFFDKRISALEKARISRERIIIDPGMGFFLSSTPEPSFAVLHVVAELKERFGLPVMISVSRKSFLRTPGMAQEDIAARTLAAELSAVEQGAEYIRTHEVRALREAVGKREK